MPQQKTGKKIECYLEGCNNKKYYYPCQIKPDREYYCCNQHRSDAAKTGKYIECQLEGCTETKYYPRCQLERNNRFYCCDKHRRKADRHRIKVYCNDPECDEFIEVVPSRIERSENFYCCEEHKYKANFLYPKTRHLRQVIHTRNHAKQQRKALKDSYVKARIRRQFDLSGEEIPEALIEMKRKQIIIHRLRHENS